MVKVSFGKMMNFVFMLFVSRSSLIRCLVVVAWLLDLWSGLSWVEVILSFFMFLF